MTKRAEPLHDRALKVETSSTICKDVKGVDAEEDGQDSLAQVSVDAGEWRSRDVFEHEDFVWSGDNVLEDHVLEFGWQAEQRKHSSRISGLRRFSNGTASSCSGRTGSHVRRDLFDDLFAQAGALVCLKACAAHDDF